MKKMHSYYMKPQQLKKRLENPKFRSTFIEWSKSSISLTKDINTKNNRSKSPFQTYEKSINYAKKISSNQSNPGKQNIRPNNNNHRSSNSKIKVISKQKMQKQINLQPKKRAISQSSSNLQKNYQSNKSLDKNYISNLSSKNRYNSCTSIDMNQNNCKKKQRSQSSTDKIQIKQNQPLTYQIKYSYRTKQGVQINNPNKTNQDSLLIKTQLNNTSDTSIFAIADGHGLYGHFVSQFLVKNLSKQIQIQCKRVKNIADSIPIAYNRLQQGLTNPQINASCSGSTLVNVIIEKDDIICANVGDSRAILARQIDRKNWQMIYLSQDHKPTLQNQKKRILKNGGKIHAFKDQNGFPVGPQRVWLPNQNMQGLAMSRSFGDNVSKPIGVTHVPQIIKLKIDKRDRFVLLASDGIWEFISNQQVLQLLVPFYRDGKLEQACDALLNLAYQRWTVQDKSIVDDITFILIFFSHPKTER